jgi:hypothetical protein
MESAVIAALCGILAISFVRFVKSFSVENVFVKIKEENRWCVVRHYNS